jgi:hypothetical protein
VNKNLNHKISGFPRKRNFWLEISHPHFNSPAVIFCLKLHVIIKSPRVSYFLPNLTLIWPKPVQWITLQYTFTVLQNEEKSYLSVLSEVVEKEITKSTKSLGLSQPKGDQKAANWETLVGADAAAGLSLLRRRWMWLSFTGASGVGFGSGCLTL